MYCKVLAVLQYRAGQVGDCIAIQQGCDVARQGAGGRLYREIDSRHRQPGAQAGALGARGVAGAAGPAGEAGRAGTASAAGRSGTAGRTGAVGRAGTAGCAGAVGLAGAVGREGTAGRRRRSGRTRHGRDAQGRAAGACGLGVPVRRLGVLAGSFGPVRVFGAPSSVLTQFLTQF